jgi:hypothetical protein
LGADNDDIGHEPIVPRGVRAPERSEAGKSRPPRILDDAAGRKENWSFVDDAAHGKSLDLAGFWPLAIKGMKRRRRFAAPPLAAIGGFTG